MAARHSALPPLPPQPLPPTLSPAAPLPRHTLLPQTLLLLWFVVEDHDTLFILSESVHFLGIGLLAYKLIKKRAAGGASALVALGGVGGVSVWGQEAGSGRCIWVAMMCVWWRVVVAGHS